MSLSTLLLSSAALVVAGSAFAADLPAKKGAPAKAATGCPAFGAGFFQIPGSDTCIQFSGHVRYKASYELQSTDGETANYGNGYRFRLGVDTRSNSELGVIRGYARLNATPAASVDRAYVSFSNLTVGRMGSLADIAGTNGDTYGSNLGGGTGIGARYDMPLGTSTLSLAVENSADNNVDDSGTITNPASDRPDLLVGLKSALGPVNVNIVGVSHQATMWRNDNTSPETTEGYAILGRLGVSAGGFGVAVFGGAANAASAYVTDVSATGIEDYTSNGQDNVSSATNIGGEITYTLGAGTLAIAADQSAQSLDDHHQATITNVGVSYAFNLAKGLSVEPEFIHTTQTDDSSNDGTTTNTVYLRIQRDF